MASRFHLSAEQTEEVIARVRGLMRGKTLILVRGIPGQGKSTLGRAMAQRFSGTQVETDTQFMVSGEYVFDPAKVGDAQLATQLEVRNLLIENASCVVVTNTFTREWEITAYRQLASNIGYRVVIVDLLLCVQENSKKTNQYFDAAQFLEFLCAANVHSVPADKIRAMYDRYERSDRVIRVHDYFARGGHQGHWRSRPRFV